MQPGNHKGFSIILLLVLLFLAAVLGAGGWFGWRVYSSASQPRANLVGAKVKPELIAFVHRQLPNLYTQLIAVDDTIALVNAEVDRLAGIAKQYPDQKPLVEAAREKLGVNKKALTKALVETLAKVETLYVTYLMDPRKGQRALKKERTIIRRLTRDALRTHAALRQRLSRQQSESKGLLDQLLALVGK
jgi:hypothetical protein